METSYSASSTVSDHIYSLSNPFSNVENTQTTAAPPTFDAGTREQLVQLLIDDIPSHARSPHAARAMLAIKTLGKNPHGSLIIAKPDNLTALLTFASKPNVDPDACAEALRSIANALLLVDAARRTFVNAPVRGGDVVVVMFESAVVPDQIFILSRILFLATVTAPDYIVTLVRERHIFDIVKPKFESLTSDVMLNIPMAREAMADMLKFIFNILMHFPKMAGEPTTASSHDERKVIGDFWSADLNPILTPVLTAFYALASTIPSPLTSPLSHIIHALITIPINDQLRNTWFPPPEPVIYVSPAPTHHRPVFLGGRAQSTLDRALNAVRTFSRSPRPSAPSGGASPPKSRPDKLRKGRRSLSLGRTTTLTVTPQLPVPARPDIFNVAYNLLDSSFEYYFPGDIEPDHASVRKRVKESAPDATIDDTLTPLVVLVTRLCMADTTTTSSAVTPAARLLALLCPPDLDRSPSAPLEGRPNLLGRLLRLLACVYHPRLKDAAGELLWTDATAPPLSPERLTAMTATRMSALLGYGNIAGYLFNRGVMSAPGVDETSGGYIEDKTPARAINPITGTYETPRNKSDLPEMTEEEKEAEMEKLFVLFDRLERTGAIPKEQNPVRKAIQKSQQM
ncbi:hypothetical protein FISHEDRAFT_34994 [Fistulina hepatica ATCC 64428]|uniref:Synembryn-A n=1 Tax=Fistulina hepatica ATCC 64428 TaxID=1128425 RepID=A0A0D7AL19_9AGAR|nr:hypothetical protein FISHEDRAFT_34994 [Fistulina hepatica ATCC 64428]